MTKKNTKLLRNKKLIPISIIILCLFFVGYVLHPINADWLLGSSAYTSVGEHPNDVYSPLKRLLLYVIILTTMLSFLILVPKHKVKLTYIGRRTMQVYLLHGLVIGVVRGYKLFPFKNLLTYIRIFIYLACLQSSS